MKFYHSEFWRNSWNTSLCTTLNEQSLLFLWFCTLILLALFFHSHIYTKRCCCSPLQNSASGSTERHVHCVFCFDSKPYIGFGQNKVAWHEQTENTTNHVSSLGPCSLKDKFKFMRSDICAFAGFAGRKCLCRCFPWACGSSCSQPFPHHMQLALQLFLMYCSNSPGKPGPKKHKIQK